MYQHGKPYVQVHFTDGSAQRYNDIKKAEVDIQKRRLSSITNDMIKKLHSAIGGGEKGLRSPYQANRVVAYLKMFFNQAIEKKWCSNNPCKIKSKKLYA